MRLNNYLMVRRELDLCLKYRNKQMNKAANKHSFTRHCYAGTKVMKSHWQTFWMDTKRRKKMRSMRYHIRISCNIIRKHRVRITDCSFYCVNRSQIPQSTIVTWVKYVFLFAEMFGILIKYGWNFPRRSKKNLLKLNVTHCIVECYSCMLFV